MQIVPGTGPPEDTVKGKTGQSYGHHLPRFLYLQRRKTDQASRPSAPKWPHASACWTQGSLPLLKCSAVTTWKDPRMLLSNTDPGKPTTLSLTRAFQNYSEHCREKQGEKIGNEESLQTFWLTQTWPATQASLLLPEPLTRGPQGAGPAPQAWFPHMWLSSSAWNISSHHPLPRHPDLFPVKSKEADFHSVADSGLTLALGFGPISWLKRKEPILPENPPPPLWLVWRVELCH